MGTAAVTDNPGQSQGIIFVMLQDTDMFGAESFFTPVLRVVKKMFNFQAVILQEILGIVYLRQ